MNRSALVLAAAGVVGITLTVLVALRAIGARGDAGASHDLLTGERPVQDPASPIAELSAPSSSTERRYSEPQAATTESKTVPSPPDESLAARWAAEYQSYSIDLLAVRSKELRSELLTRVQPEAEKLAAAGRAEYLGKGTTYNPPPEDFTLLRNVYIPGKGSDEEIRRVTFSREEYPELYALKDEVDWIEKEMAERRRRQPY